MMDLEILTYLQLFKKYKDDEIRARRKFEKDLFIVLMILFCISVIIMVSCFKIEKYLEEIMKSVIAIEYK